MRSLIRSLIILGLTSANIVLLAQTQKTVAGGVIQGIVQSGSTPLPGVTVTATNAVTNEKVSTSTDLNGQYQLKPPSMGAYNVEASMAAFAPAAKQTEIKDSATAARLDFDLMLASRSQQAAAQPRPTAGVRGRGAQRLQIEPAPQGATQSTEEELTAQVPADVQVPGFATDAPTESVAVLGNIAQTTFGNNFNFDREQIQQLIDQQFGVPGGPGGQGGRGGAADAQAGGPGNPVGGFPGGGGPGGRGGGGRGGVGRGGGGGGRGFAFGRGGRGFGATTPRGNLSYTLSDSDFDAAPFSLTGQPSTKPAYTQNRFSATLGGPLVIPKIVKSTSSNYSVTYNGVRSRNPYDVFSTVPTLTERAGDFSQSTIRNGVDAGNPVQIFDPITHAAIANNVLSQSLINPAAQGLLAFIPAPNLPGPVQNFHYVTSNTNNSDNVNVRFNHTFANPQQQQGGGRGGGGRGGFGGGRGGGRGGRGTNINFGLQISSGSSIPNNPFPTISGRNTTSGVNATMGYVRSFGRLNNLLNLTYNRNRTTGTNLYAFQQDIEGSLGIAGVSRNPFDWGIPNLSFTNFSSLNDIRSSLRRDQTLQLSENMLWNRGKHNLRWGTDVRIQQTNTHSTQNSRGTFTFTGARTAAVVGGAPTQGTGYDFADFLLGLPQSTSLQYGDLTYNFRGSSWDVYLQDDWRIRGNLTLNLGLRYDYASPYVEKDNQIVNLDAAPGFVAVVPVLPGQAGLYNGTFPRSLVRPDRNNVAPRVGIAWRANNRTVVRTAYGVTYNGAAYAAIASQMANQPPFSIAQTNTNAALLTLQNGFPPVTSSVTNNYGIDPNYRIGYAQQWNVDVQRDLRKLGIQMNLDYTGTKGTRLDVIEAPNRTATGLRIANVQPFNWETSDADSILHSGSVRVQRRLARGISFGGTYQFSKSIDNASSVSGGGGNGTLAQDAFNLRAERGLSSFDQPHRLNLNYNVELPFGTNKRFFSEPSLLKTMFGDWLLNGSWTITSGNPATARVLGSYTDVARGSNGSLRADATGLPVSLSDASVPEWFNTAAFTVPLPGRFGNVGRNTIRGPAQFLGNLTLNKTFPFADGRSLDVRAQASNFLNTPQFRAIDTTVNSPSFGRVTTAGSMRKIQLVARFNF